jgi:hypothetical protein
MAMNWEQNQLDRYDRIIERDLGKLLREGSTEFNFLEIRRKVELTQQAVAQLKENYDFWEQLPEVSRNEINSKIDQIAEVFDRMESFDPKQNNAWSERNGVISVFESQYRELYSFLVEKVNAYLGQKAYAKELSSKFGKEAKTELAEIRKYKREIEKIKADVQQAETIAGDVASTAIARNFDKQAEEHQTTARNWMKATIGSGAIVGIITLVFSLNIVLNWENLNQLLDNTAVLTVKLVIVGIALIALRFCIKNYSANRHLYVINKHRANVLKAMEAFRTSAIEDAAKDAVLLSAVGAAFGQMETGFITTKEGAGPHNDEIAPELISAISVLNKK